MEIAVEVHDHDYKAFIRAIQYYARYENYSGPKGSGLPIGNMFVGALIGIAILIIFKVLGEKIHWLSIGIGVVLMLGYSVYFNQKYQKKLISSRDGIVIGKQNYQILDTGVDMTTSLYQTRYKWQAFSALEETDQYFFLMMDAGIGHIIPKNQLSSDQAHKLKEICGKYIAA